MMVAYKLLLDVLDFTSSVAGLFVIVVVVTGALAFVYRRGR